jgi:outer membrane protein assembly factor BamB
VSIVVQCPHCETKFNLQPEMIGRSMRCPNLDCRQTFIVKDTGRAVEPLPPEPAPPLPATTRRAEKPRAAAPAKPAVVEAEIVEAAVVAPPKVKEVVWSAGKDVPPPKGKGKKPVRAEVEEGDDTPPARRKKQKNRRPWLLIGMSVAVVLVLGFGVFYILRYQSKAEAALAAQAKQEYDSTSYAVAAKTYSELAEKYPDSEKAEEYRFFADLASLQVVARALAAGDNPEATIGRLKSFIQTHQKSPLAQHTSGYGRDIHEAGRKLGDDVVAHAAGRVEKFRTDRAKHAEELKLAEKAVATGRELLPLLEPFRGPDERPLDKVRDGLDDVERQVRREYARTAALAKAAAQLEKVSDAMIQAAETDLAATGFLDDPDAQALIATAKGRLREMVKFEAMEAAPRAAPTSASATVLFVTPVGPTRRAPPTAGAENVPPSVFLCVARGILYALDEETGTLLWAVRVGPDAADPPTVTRVELDGGPTDLALVASNAGEPALAAYVVKTGLARWYQPLPAPAAGPAVVVGGRAYVALRDPEGSVYEFDITSGTRKGRIRLGQPAGPGLVVRPGTGLLYAAADARRVFVIDAGAKDDGGAPVPPRCVQVIGTRHEAGTLRTPPVLIGPEGDAASERWMVLPQTDGKLRAFVLPPIQPPPADGSVPLESAATPDAELPLDGWVWFPPASDGERLALVTDRGEFRVFGVKQPSNFDKAVFPLPSPALPAPAAGTAVRGLVLPAEESAFWVLANGTVQKFRVANIPSRSLEVVVAGPAAPIGEPTQPPQLNNRRDAACLVVRSQTSAGCKAVLLNLATGELRWQRQLGVIPAAPPIPHEGVVVLAAEDGGLVAVPGTGATATGQTTVAPPAWVIGVPPENATGPTRVALSADGKSAFTVTPVVAKEEGKPVAQYVIRRVAGGRVVHEGVVAAPGAIAGAPVVLGESLLIPASDGFVHRHTAGTSRANPDTLTAGPPWAGGPRGADVECSITPTSDTAFLTNDGGKQLKAWTWPRTGSYSQGTGKWEMRDRPAGPGVVLPPLTAGDSPRLLIADVSGTVRLYAADRGGEHLKQWRPGGAHPPGKPSSPLVVQADTAGRLVVAFTVEDRSLVCLDPEKDGLMWAVRLGDEADATLVGAPQPAGAGRWLATDLGGRVTLYDAEGGKSPPLAIALPGAVPARAAGSVGGSGILAPLSDGSAVVLTPPAGPPAAPAPKPKE